MCAAIDGRIGGRLRYVYICSRRCHKLVVSEGEQVKKRELRHFKLFAGGQGRLSRIVLLWLWLFRFACRPRRLVEAI